jgi:hypothetical protein
VIFHREFKFRKAEAPEFQMPVSSRYLRKSPITSSTISITRGKNPPTLSDFRHGCFDILPVLTEILAFR